MMGAHPEKCPELTELADMLGLGLSPETLEDFVPTEQPLEDVLLWVDACPTCSENLATLDSWQDEVGYPDVSIVARERNRALELWKALQDVPTDELPDHVGDAHLFWAMSVLFQHKSREANRFSMKRAMMLSQIAVHLSDLLPESFYTPRLLADLRARARAYYGNALRLAGQIKDANQVFDQAIRLLDKGSGGTLVRAVVFDFLGSLRRYERRLGEAADVLKLACSLYEAAGRQDKVGMVSLNLGEVESLRGNLEGAVATVTAAQEMIDPRHSPDLFNHCQHQLTHLLTEAGYFEEAELRTPLIRRFYQEAGDSTNLTRVGWMEARIHQGLGRISSARKEFARVAADLAATGQAADLGALKLDIACLECSEQNYPEVERLASEAYTFFAANEAPAYCMQALTLLEQAARERTVTVEAIRTLSAYLQNPAEHTRRPFLFR